MAKKSIIIIATAGIVIGGVIVFFLLTPFVSPTSQPNSLENLNREFLTLLEAKTPSWTAYPAVKIWWEAKVAKERSDFDLSERKLTEAINLIKPAKKVSYDEILKYVGAPKHPIPKGKLKPPENGAYTGVWQFPILCSPINCPKGGFDQITDTHSALVFFTSVWYSLAPAYNYDFEQVINKLGHFSWDNLFSFENSFILNPTLGRNGQPLILSFKQGAELLAQYGSVMVFSWIMGYPPVQSDWAGGKDYHPEKMKGKAPTAPEILNGEWDNYIRKVAKEANNVNAPLLIELTHEFNAPTMTNNAFWSFGASGDKASLEICNSNYTRDDMTKSMNNMELLTQKIREGKIKADCPELYNQYGNSAMPDGPERQRDIWIHVKKIFDEENVKNVAWFEHTGDNFGTGFVNTILPWDKIDYYWPGDKNIDFIGTSVYYKDTESADRNRSQPSDTSTFHAAANLAQAVGNSQYWKNTPVLLLEFAFLSETEKTEEKNIERIFGQYLPRDFKNVKGFTFLDWPPTFGAAQEIQAWKKNVSQNPYYIQYPIIK